MFLKKVHDEIQNREDRSFKLEVVHYEEIDQDLGDHHIEQRLRTLKSSEARIILLYSTTVRARHLFQIADGLGLLSEKYLWIGTQSVKGSMTTASSPFRPGMLTVNFHTVSNAMFPMMIDDVLPTMIGLAPKVRSFVQIMLISLFQLFSLAIDKLGLSKSQSLQSSPSCSTSNRNNVIWQLGQQIYEFIFFSKKFICINKKRIQISAK
jgi:hypothetical protein